MQSNLNPSSNLQKNIFLIHDNKLFMEDWKTYTFMKEMK